MIRNGSVASGSKQWCDLRRGAPLSQNCLAPIAMAALKAATFRRMDSSAKVEIWCGRLADRLSLRDRGSSRAKSGAGG
eukprot:5607926-Pleurochrysis_carterae.AAC.1